MMNFEVMRRLVAEAETGTKGMPTAQAALAHWEHDDGTLKHLRYSANAIYTYKQAGVTRILRLTHAGDRSIEHIRAELDFIQYLVSRGIPAMPALPSRSGERVVTLDRWTRFYAAAFELAQGDLYLEVETLSLEQMSAWGRTMAALHLAAQDYQPVIPERRPQWGEVVETLEAWLPTEDELARKALAQMQAWLSSLPTTPEDYGLIHWDLCADNLGWDGEGYHIFDFDDAAYFWYAADLAFALDDLSALPSSQREHMLEAFFSGYRSLRPAIENWLEHLPRFVKFMHLFKYARDLRAMRFADTALDPPWMAELRLKLQRMNDLWRDELKEPF